MANRRQKRRTHVKPSKADDPSVPKSFVIRSGELTRNASQLVKDLRQILEPNTASRLKERKTNRLKDFVTMAGPLGVTHFLLLSQTERHLNLRLARTPRGPTAHFRVASYCLRKDVAATQLRPKSPGLEYNTAPLLVLNHFDAERPEHKLLCSILQNLFPTMNTAKIRLGDVRRVVLFQWDVDSNAIEFRHYLIQAKPVGVSRTIKQLILPASAKSKIPDLHALGDVSEFLAGNASESEIEEDSLVTLAQDYLGRTNKKAEQRAIQLLELGPRMKLELTQISEGFCGGNLLYTFLETA